MSQNQKEQEQKEQRISNYQNELIIELIEYCNNIITSDENVDFNVLESMLHQENYLTRMIDVVKSKNQQLKNDKEKKPKKVKSSKKTSEK